VVDFKSLKLTGKPNQFLVLPQDYQSMATPHSTSPIFSAPTDQVREALLQVINAAPRTEIIENNAQIKVVQRSKLMRFPDTINIEIIPVDENNSTLATLSSSKYGHSDLGVNRKRVEGWLNALSRAL